MRRRIFVLAMMAACGATLRAQEAPPIPVADSLKTLAPAPHKKQAGVDAPITYTAQTIENLVEKRITILTGKAEVKYKTATLQAGRITVDWDHNLLIAEPLPDSLQDGLTPQNGKADSTARHLRGVPVFADGSDRMSGEKMEYNFATERGRVLRGRKIGRAHV